MKRNGGNNMTKTQDKNITKADQFASEFMAEQQRLADEAGVNLYVYLANSHGGILKPTIIKMIKHAQAHTDKCPEDCAFQASLKSLKEKYSD
jgi:hypothetical protein